MVDSTVSANIKKTLFSRTTLLALLACIAVVPLLIPQVIRFWNTPMWWFVPFAMAFFAYFVLRAPKVGFAAHPTRRLWGVIGLVSGVCTGLAAAFLESVNLAHLSVLLVVTSWFMLTVGIMPWTRVIACSSLIWITWPMPSALVERFDAKLKVTAVQTASSVLDQVGVKHLVSDSEIELKKQALDAESLFRSAGSLPALLFFTLTTMLFTRHPLLLGCVILGCAVTMSWLGNVLMILLQVSLLENQGIAWDTGWLLPAAQMGIFLWQVTMVAGILYGVSYLLDGVPVDSTHKADEGWHGIYNRAVVWPLNFVPTKEAEEIQSYMEDDQPLEKPAKRTKPRNTPSYAAVNNASALFGDNRLFYSTLVICLFTGLLMIAGVLIPPRATALPAMSLALRSELGLDSSMPQELAGMNLVAKDLPDSEELPATFAWSYQSPDDEAVFSLKYPSSGVNLGGKLEAWQTVAKTLAVDEKHGWTVCEIEYVDAIGNRAFGWYTAFDLDGNNAAPENLIARLGKRLRRSVLGRLLGMQTDEFNFHSQLFVQSQSRMSTRRKSELRSSFVEVNRTLLSVDE